jgi:hypothetical protein
MVLDKGPVTSMRFLSACRGMLVEVLGTSFVDDSSLGVTSDYQYDQTSSEQVNRAREVAHVVRQLLTLA